MRLHLTDDVVALWEALEKEFGTVGLDPPFWAAAWPGGQALARYLLDTPSVVAGRRVLDVGAGSGLVAIAAARAGAAAVTASDVDPYARAVIPLNAAQNRTPVPEVAGDLLGAAATGWDVICAGDVCYDRAMAGRVLRFLRAARAAGATVLLGDPGRAYAPVDGVTAVAAYEVADSDGGPLRRATVWSLD